MVTLRRLLVLLEVSRLENKRSIMSCSNGGMFIEFQRVKSLHGFRIDMVGFSGSGHSVCIVWDGLLKLFLEHRSSVAVLGGRAWFLESGVCIIGPFFASTNRRYWDSFSPLLNFQNSDCCPRDGASTFLEIFLGLTWLDNVRFCTTVAYATIYPSPPHWETHRILQISTPYCSRSLHLATTQKVCIVPGIEKSNVMLMLIVIGAKKQSFCDHICSSWRLLCGVYDKSVWIFSWACKQDL